MSDIDRTGQLQIQELIKNIYDPIFTDTEQNFIRDLGGKKYSELTKHKKLVVARLISWLHGNLL